MTKRFLLVFLLVVLIPLPALAKTCGPYANIRAALAIHAREAPFIQAIMANGNLMEIWRNHNSSSWTVVVTGIQDGSKVSCMVASGSDIQPVIWAVEDKKT